MNVAAYFTLTADGYLPGAEDNDLPPPDNILRDTKKRALKLGSLIVGRTSYESMEEGESPVPLVVVTKGRRKDKEGVFFAQSPKRALTLMEHNGFTGALVGGGAKLFSSFLAANVVDEL